MMLMMMMMLMLMMINMFATEHTVFFGHCRCRLVGNRDMTKIMVGVMRVGG